MASLRYRAKVDLGVAAITVAIGAFFTYQVSLIEAVQVDAIGPQLLPYFLSISMIVLGVWVGIASLYFNAQPKGSEEESDAAHAAAEENFGFRDSDLGKVFAVIAMGFIYIGLFHILGYLISTIISMALMMLVFGNRKPLQIIVMSLAAAFAYDYVFMNLMGLYDPPGEWFDLTRFLENPSLEELTRKLPF